MALHGELMNVRNRTIRGHVSSDHIVQFFDTDESRAHNVAAFLAEGYGAGEPLMMVARPANAAAICEQLERRGVPVRRAAEEGMLIVKDAEDTLRLLSRGGSLDETLFSGTIGTAVRALEHKGRIRAYGEMVDILAQRGELPAVMALEQFWNDLAERVSLSLLCGYSAAHFVSTTTHRALREICSAHSDVHRTADDPLGDWLLTTAHNAAASSRSLIN
jgi:hypothetical protein